MLRELQKLLADERLAKEGLEHQASFAIVILVVHTAADVQNTKGRCVVGVTFGVEHRIALNFCLFTCVAG